jgi:hypothetical protein
MDVDDPRHGTEAGNSAHMRDGEKSCAPCRKARGKADKRRRVYGSGLVVIPADVLQTFERYSVRTIELHTGLSGCTINNIRKHGDKARVKPSTVSRVRAMKVPTDIGVIRRVRALARLGWSSPEMAARAGIPATTVARLRDHDERQWVGNQRIRAAIAKAYDEMSMTVPPLTRHTSKLANRAEARGWAPPLAWDDIDDPDAIPTEGYSPRGNAIKPIPVDDVVVDRILDGQVVPSTNAERREVVRRWLADGRSYTSLEALTGWRVERYFEAA